MRFPSVKIKRAKRPMPKATVALRSAKPIVTALYSARILKNSASGTISRSAPAAISDSAVLNFPLFWPSLRLAKS